MKLKRFGWGLVALAALSSAALGQARPPAQKTGPITIYGDGSSGPADLFTVKPPGLSKGRSLNNIVDDLPITPEIWSNLNVGNDSTASLQTAINYALANNRPLKCDKLYSVTKLVVPTGGLRIEGMCGITGIATVPTSAVLEIQGGVLTVAGSINVSANYNTNYDSAILWKNSTQYSYVQNLSASAAKTCFTIGSEDQPSALLSEVTIVGGRTYGCTQAMKVIGVEAVVHIIGTILSADPFGAPSPDWAGIPYRGIVAIGSGVFMTGGELLMTAIIDGAMIENRPLTGPGANEGTYYSRLRFTNVTMEGASRYAIAVNPKNLTIAPKSGQRGSMVFINVDGYHSQDNSPLIFTEASYDGYIVWQNSPLTYPGLRNSFNIQADGTKADIYVDDIGFGKGFKDPISGTVGGVVHHSFRNILSANQLAGQSFTGATTAKFTGLNADNNRQRYVSNYNPATGVFTVPAGGLKELKLTGFIQFTTAVAGDVFVNKKLPGGSAVQVARGILTNGVASVNMEDVDLPEGTEISMLVATGSSMVAGTPDFMNNMRISARN